MANTYLIFSGESRELTLDTPREYNEHVARTAAIELHHDTGETVVVEFLGEIIFQFPNQTMN